MSEYIYMPLLSGVIIVTSSEVKKKKNKEEKWGFKGLKLLWTSTFRCNATLG